MLRVGLTGGLGSGKSTAAGLLGALGAHILSADAVGRELMQPGGPVYDGIVSSFGREIVLADGQLDRRGLARAAFAEGRSAELNAIVHPAVIGELGARTARLRAEDSRAIVVTESALIFETEYGETQYGETPSRKAADGKTPGAPGEGQPWRTRFDKLILVRASEQQKIARFIARSNPQASQEEREALTREAERRLALQSSDDLRAARCDYVLMNDGGISELEWQIDQLWPLLIRDEAEAAALRRAMA